MTDGMTGKRTDRQDQMVPSHPSDASAPLPPGGSKKERVTETAQRLVGETRQKLSDQVRTGIDDRRHRTAGTLNTIANSLRQPNGIDDESTRRFMEKAGDQVQRFADYLENTDLPQIGRQAEDLARRQPAVFLGTAFILGLAAARFFKSGREHHRIVEDAEVRRASAERMAMQGSEGLGQEAGQWTPSPTGPETGLRDRPLGNYGPGPYGSMEQP